jgi:hypothetical protein
MINNMNMNFEAKINNKESKINTTSQKKTFISNLMLYIARGSTNYNNSTHNYLKATRKIFFRRASLGNRR